MESLAKIGIDLWGMVLYLVNYGLLLGVLAYFFYPKIIKAMDERRHIIKKNIEDTEHLQKVFKMQIENHKKEKEEMQAQIQKQGADLKKEWQEKRSELIQQMESERQKMMEDTKAELGKEKKEIVQSAEAEVLKIMKKVLMEVASQKIPEEVVTQSVAESWNKYKTY